MKKRLGLSELSVISWVSAIEGCPLSRVPLYMSNMYTYIHTGFNTNMVQYGSVISFCSVFVQRSCNDVYYSVFIPFLFVAFHV